MSCTPFHLSGVANEVAMFRKNIQKLPAAPPLDVVGLSFDLGFETVLIELSQILLTGA